MTNRSGALIETRVRVRNLILCGLFAALTVVCAMISVPLPFTPVPVSLATLAVFLSGGLLGARCGAAAQAVYVLLGAVGLPVFSGLSGGLAKLVGPTGGYIIGYIFAAAVIGLLCGEAKDAGKVSALRLALRFVLAMILGLLLCYALGTAWFVFSTHTPVPAALGLCVFPFLLGDAMKIAVATLLCARLRPFLR